VRQKRADRHARNRAAEDRAARQKKRHGIHGSISSGVRAQEIVKRQGRRSGFRAPTRKDRWHNRRCSRVTGWSSLRLILHRRALRRRARRAAYSGGFSSSRVEGANWRRPVASGNWASCIPAFDPKPPSSSLHFLGTRPLRWVLGRWFKGPLHANIRNWPLNGAGRWEISRPKVGPIIIT
jgi:hypothetical protein